jgi:hypothetical protein
MALESAGWRPGACPRPADPSQAQSARGVAGRSRAAGKAARARSVRRTVPGPAPLCGLPRSVGPPPSAAALRAELDPGRGARSDTSGAGRAASRASELNATRPRMTSQLERDASAAEDRVQSAQVTSRAWASPTRRPREDLLDESPCVFVQPRTSLTFRPGTSLTLLVEKAGSAIRPDFGHRILSGFRTIKLRSNLVRCSRSGSGEPEHGLPPVAHRHCPRQRPSRDDRRAITLCAR